MKFQFFIMSVLCGLILCLQSSLAIASETPVCQDWPRLVGVTTPSMAVTDHPFHLSLRFDCLLKDQYVFEDFTGSFEMNGQHIVPSRRPVGVTIPRGNLLYQYLFSVRGDQPSGIYTLKSCLNLKRTSDGEVRCYNLERRLELRSRLN